MFGKVMYFSVFYFFCYDMDISIDIPEEQVSEEIDLDLNQEEDIRMDGSMEDHWRDIYDEGDNNNNIHALRWEVYIKDKQDFIKR